MSTSRPLTDVAVVAAPGQVLARKKNRMSSDDPDLRFWAKERLAPKGHTVFRRKTTES
jgi:hypothetical protein